MKMHALVRGSVEWSGPSWIPTAGGAARQPRPRPVACGRSQRKMVATDVDEDVKFAVSRGPEFFTFDKKTMKFQ